MTVGYPGGILAHMHVSWLDPSKTRRTTVVGSQKMLVYDDLDAEAKLKVFDKGADRLEADAYGAYQYRLRDGAMNVPSLPMVEPLAAELQHFIDCVDTGARPLVDGWNGCGRWPSSRRPTSPCARRRGRSPWRTWRGSP